MNALVNSALSTQDLTNVESASTRQSSNKLDSALAQPQISALAEGRISISI